MTEQDRKIAEILMSINSGYEKLEVIESELEVVRNKRSEIMFDNNKSGDKS